MNKTYQIFRISLLKLVIGRFLIIIAGVFLPLAFILHVVLDVGMNVSENAQTIIAIPIILLVAAYLNFFLLNYTFEVGNGHVIVSRLSLKGKKIIGQYKRSTHFLRFGEVRARGAVTRILYIKPKTGGKEKSFAHGLSKKKIKAMQEAIETLEAEK